MVAELVKQQPEVIQSSNRVATQYERKALEKNKEDASFSQEKSTIVTDEKSSPASRKRTSKGKQNIRESSQIQRNYKAMVRAVIQSQYQRTFMVPRVTIIIISWFVIFAGVMIYAFLGTDYMVPIMPGFDVLNIDDNFCFFQTSLPPNQNS